jgi:outer membrane receptor protein involved in Fe transport
MGGIDINGPLGALDVNLPPPVADEGGKANASAFSPDRLWTYEIGTKTSLLDGRLTADVATWLTTWQSVQSDQILADGELYIANVGNVRDPGFEADLDFQPIDHLRLRGNAFWNDPEITEPNPLLIQTKGRLPGVPEIGFGGSARYDLPLWDGYDAFAGLDYAYTGKSHIGFDVRNSPTMGNYGTTNLRLGLARDRWQGLLYVDNLTDEHANSFAYGNPFLVGRVGQTTPLRPLTIGLRASVTF